MSNSIQESYRTYYNYSQTAYSLNQLPPTPKKRKSKLFRFIVLVAIIGVITYFSFNLVSKNEVKPEESQVNFGFTIQPNDPYFDRQFALDRIGAGEAWKITSGSSKVIVAVIDTGVDANHPDLKDKLVPGYDFVDNDTEPEDTVGHGTFVASLIAASGNNKEGIVGLAPDVKIMPLKVMKGEQGASNYNIARAIQYATDKGARVINMSLGGPYNSRSISQAVDYAVAKNVVVVAASGNEARWGNPVEYPAALSKVISVGATSSNNQVASFSNYNKAVDIVAPGVNILGARSTKNSMCRAYNNTPYCVASGTSFSSPYVAAAASLVISVNPKLTSAQVQAVLMETATDLGISGIDVYYGAGLLNAAKAVELAQEV